MTELVRGQTYRAAIIGCGGMGRTHGRGLSRMKELELVGLSDIVQESLDRARQEMGVSPERCYLDYIELLDRQKPDFIVIATQVPQHASITLAAAERGIHVLCEKPLALNLAEADQMVDACDRAGVRLGMGHLRRVGPAEQQARALVASGEIGEILAIDIHDKGGRPVGNTLMEMATHYFDIARFILGGHTLADGRSAAEVEWVFAHLSTGLGADAHPAVFDEIVPSQVAKPTDRDCGLVLGERGTVMIGLAGEVQAVARFHNLSRSDTHYDGVDVIGTNGSIAMRRATSNMVFHRQGHTFAEQDSWKPIPVTSDRAYTETEQRDEAAARCQRMAREMIAAIEEERDPIANGREGRIALEIIMAVYESHRQGRPIPLPLVDRRHPLEIWQSETPEKIR